MRIGVIGTGSMGENHVRAYSSMKDYCTLIGIYDNNPARVKEVANKYAVKGFNNIDDLLCQVDAVSIAVPTKFHYDTALKCIKYNVHMLIEKPITSSAAEAEDLIKKADKAGVKIQVGHIELYNPMIKVLKKIIAEENVLAIDVHRLSPFSTRIVNNDVVNDLMIHDLYILYELLNDEIDQFFALGQIYENTIKHAVVISRFKRGVIGQLTASFKTKEKNRTIRIITDKAFIQANLLEKKVLISRAANYFSDNINTTYNLQNVIEKVIIPDQDSLKVQLIDFVQCIKNNTQPTITGRDGLTALAIANKISGYIWHNHPNKTK